MNLDYAKPFANTSDLKAMTPKIHAELAEQKQEADEEKKYLDDQNEIKMKEDPITKLLKSARQAQGKQASRADIEEEKEKQIFNMYYQREHTIAFL